MNMKTLIIMIILTSFNLLATFSNPFLKNEVLGDSIFMVILFSLPLSRIAR